MSKRARDENKEDAKVPADADLQPPPAKSARIVIDWPATHQAVMDDIAREKEEAAARAAKDGLKDDDDDDDVQVIENLSTQAQAQPKQEEEEQEQDDPQVAAGLASWFNKWREADIARKQVSEQLEVLERECALDESRSSNIMAEYQDLKGLETQKALRAVYRRRLDAILATREQRDLKREEAETWREAQSIHLEWFCRRRSKLVRSPETMAYLVNAIAAEFLDDDDWEERCMMAKINRHAFLLIDPPESEEEYGKYARLGSDFVAAVKVLEPALSTRDLVQWLDAMLQEAFDM